MRDRFAFLDPHPELNGGRWPARAVPDEEVPVSVTLACDGHSVIRAQAQLHGPDGDTQVAELVETHPGTDRWSASLTPTSTGSHRIQFQAWIDRYLTWRSAAKAKVTADVDVELTLLEGSGLLNQALRAATGSGRTNDAQLLRSASQALADPELAPAQRLAAATDPEVAAVLHRHPLAEDLSTSAPLLLQVDRERALVGSWYEFFPRSEGASDGRSGTFATAALRLPGIAAMGFDVVYLPPIHPIGFSQRKGRHGTLPAAAADPGSPWAVGAATGGHDAIHPDLGGAEDFAVFMQAAAEVGLEVALDLALQASPDHPWLRTNPEWFARRPDGSIAHAENPPKQYEDIHPLSFATDPDGLTAEVVRIIRHWMQHGVRIFRVDNPHTKPLWFWESVLSQIRATDPDVVFLSEAFTRPTMLQTLAKTGFHQSYTYFTWRTGRDELADYLDELSNRTGHFLRPNLFVNTPDILHGSLQSAGPPMFAIRAIIAATASPSWGMYSGYELFENQPAQAGSEEYHDSEKYRYLPRDWAGMTERGHTLAPLLTQLNAIRARHISLRRLRGLRVHEADDDLMLAYSRTAMGPAGPDTMLTVVSLDPDRERRGVVHVDPAAVGGRDCFKVQDELSGETWDWEAGQELSLSPDRPAVILSVS
jgi:starch synthase (maltosyl-transferring)